MYFVATLDYHSSLVTRRDTLALDAEARCSEDSQPSTPFARAVLAKHLISSHPRQLPQAQVMVVVGMTSELDGLRALDVEAQQFGRTYRTTRR